MFIENVETITSEFRRNGIFSRLNMPFRRNSLVMKRISYKYNAPDGAKSDFLLLIHI